jgi:hypothetical protein
MLGAVSYPAPPSRPVVTDTQVGSSGSLLQLLRCLVGDGFRVSALATLVLDVPEVRHDSNHDDGEVACNQSAFVSNPMQ